LNEWEELFVAGGFEFRRNPELILTSTHPSMLLLRSGNLTLCNFSSSTTSHVPHPTYSHNNHFSVITSSRYTTTNTTTTTPIIIIINYYNLLITLVIVVCNLYCTAVIIVQQQQRCMLSV